MELLNSLYPGILEFTHVFHKSQIDFLDLHIELQDGRITTDLYTKPTNTGAYLHYDSYHSSSTKDGIVFSQALRVKSICSDPAKTTEHLHVLGEKFKSRGYPSAIIGRQLEKARSITREVLLSRENVKRRPPIIAPLVVTRNPKLPDLHVILRKHFHILQLSQNFRNLLPVPPKIIFRHPKNLQSLIVKAKVSSRGTAGAEYRGTFRTHARNCVTCLALS